MPANINYPVSGSQKVANIFNTDHAAADEGSFYVTCSATGAINGNVVSAAVAMTTSVVDDAATASSTHAQFAPAMYIQNGGASGDVNAKTIYLRYLRVTQIIANQAWTSATNAQFWFRGDIGNRYSSGGTLYTPQNINMGSSNLSKGIVYAGAIIPTGLPSPSTSRLLARGQIQGTIPLPGDQWMFTFGDSAAPTNILGASGIKNMTIPCGPIVIGPGTHVQLDIWATSLAAAPAFEFELGWVERFSGL